MTANSIEMVYSGVEIFLTGLNHLEGWEADVTLARFDGHITEKVFIIADPEFGTSPEWSALKTPSVESATYGSELTAAYICVDRIVETYILLRYLGVPI